MSRGLLGIVLLGVFGGCSSEALPPEVTSDIPDAGLQSEPFDIPPEACWWCVDAEGYFDISMNPVVTDEGELNPDGYKTIWWGDVDLNTGQGVFGFTRKQPDLLDCSAYYSVVSSAPGPTCDSCSFTWTMTLGEGVIAEDMGGCAPALALDGATISYGHGKDLVFQDYGFSLYVDEGEGWLEVGVSIVENETRWTFFRDVVEEETE